MDSPTAYLTTYDKLRATSLTREQHERTCGYWYTVTSGATAHTAFRTREELDAWLAERGLTLAPMGWTWENDKQVSTPLREAGEFSTVEIIGSYRKASERDPERFDRAAPLANALVMDNGEWTPAKITETDGIRTIHYMNVNYRTRAS